MKNIQKLGLLVGLCLPSLALAQAVAPQIPTGSLSVGRNLLRTGLSPTLTWAATFPETVNHVVDIDPQDTVTTKTKTQVTVRVLGVAFQSGSTLLPAKLHMKLDNGSWSQKFYGKGTSVNPSNPVYVGTHNANTKLDFKFQGAANAKGSSWYPAVTTATTSQKKIALRNGDTPPSYAPAYNQGNIKSYLGSYVKDNKITIGPRDVIYLTELYTGAPGTSAFDMQDLVVLVTFDEVPL